MLHCLSVVQMKGNVTDLKCYILSNILVNEQVISTLCNICLHEKVKLNVTLPTEGGRCYIAILNL